METEELQNEFKNRVGKMLLWVTPSAYDKIFQKKLRLIDASSLDLARNDSMPEDGERFFICVDRGNGNTTFRFDKTFRCLASSAISMKFRKEPERKPK